MTLIHPSLPPLSGIARILRTWFQPTIYDYKKHELFQLESHNPSFFVFYLERSDIGKGVDVTPSKNLVLSEVCTTNDLSICPIFI